jgi:hypothetical protein
VAGASPVAPEPAAPLAAAAAGADTSAPAAVVGSSPFALAAAEAARGGDLPAAAAAGEEAGPSASVLALRPPSEAEAESARAAEERAARKLRTRKLVVDELVRTERQYIQALQQLIDIGNALEYARLVDAPRKRVLFGDLQQIVATNMHFLHTIEERVRPGVWSDASSTVGDIVLQLAPLFRSYIPYARSFGGKYAEVSRLAESDGWPRFVQNNQRHARISIESIMIMPIQVRCSSAPPVCCVDHRSSCARGSIVRSSWSSSEFIEWHVAPSLTRAPTHRPRTVHAPARHPRASCAARTAILIAASRAPQTD